MLNRKLHICIVTNGFPALTETFITAKVLELRKLGHTITVIKNQPNAQVNSSHLKRVKEAEIEVLSFIDISSTSGLIKAAIKNPIPFFRSFSLNQAKFKKNYKAQLQGLLLTTYPFDIIHFEFSGLAVDYIDALKIVKGKTVVSCRGTAEKVKPVSQPERGERLSKLFSVVDAIHCVSGDMANTIRPYTNNFNKVFVNRPSIDATVFKRTTNYNSNESILQYTFYR